MKLKCSIYVQYNGDKPPVSGWELCNRPAPYLIDGNSVCLSHARAIGKQKHRVDNR